MSFSVNSYISDLVTKDNYNLKQFLFETFKRVGFWQLKDDPVYGLSRKEFVDLLTSNAKGYDSNRELTAERYMELQADIKRVDEFFRQVVSYSFKTKLKPEKGSLPLNFVGMVPKELYSNMPVPHAEIEQLREQYYADWNNEEVALKYNKADLSNSKYKLEVQIDYLKSLTPEQKENIFQQIKQSQIASYTEKINERLAARDRYNEALTALQNWNATGEMAQLKEFLVSQIKQGLTYVSVTDLNNSLMTMKDLTAEQYFNKTLQELVAWHKNVSMKLTKTQKTKKL